MTTQAEQSMSRELPAETVDRRRHHRVKIAILGRYMLESKLEYPCQTIDISPGGIHILAPVRAPAGERVIVYLDHIGRLEGDVVRHTEQGFAMTISATPRKREKIAAQLTWLANRDLLDPSEDRLPRTIPPNTSTALTMPDGTVHPVHIIDISPSGAALLASVEPPVGSLVIVGRTTATVVRHFNGGFAVQFGGLVPPQELHRVIA
jgi:hypothetical protein